MSFELGVWLGAEPITAQEALRRYLARDESDVTPGEFRPEDGVESGEPGSEDGVESGGFRPEDGVESGEPGSEDGVESGGFRPEDGVESGEPGSEGDVESGGFPSEGDVESGGSRPESDAVPGGPCPEVAAFYEELTSLFPDLTAENYGSSPWSEPLTVGEHFVLMSVVFPRAGEVCGVVLEMARRHPLVLFEP